MKRASSAPRSYLQQLAAPLPHPAALLHARRPVARGVGSVNAIPPIVESFDSADSSDSVGSVENFADHTRTSQPPAETSSPRSLSPQTLYDAPPSGLSGDRSNSPPPVVRAEETSFPTASTSAPARPAAASSQGENFPQTAAARTTVRQLSEPTREAAPSSFRPSPARFALSSELPHAESNRSRDRGARGVQVHIGTIEVRIAEATPRTPQPTANRKQDPISSHTGRPAHAEPISRGLAWSHGLVQG